MQSKQKQPYVLLIVRNRMSIILSEQNLVFSVVKTRVVITIITHKEVKRLSVNR